MTKLFEDISITNTRSTY